LYPKVIYMKYIFWLILIINNRNTIGFMKTITFLFFAFIGLFSLHAQDANTTDTDILNESPVKTDVDNESRLDNDTFLYPNPVTIGKNVQIINIKQGEEISVFEPNGTFISNQYVDLDKQIYTDDLIAGKYIIRTESAYLKLVVK